MMSKVPLLFLFIILYDVRNEHNTHRILEDMLALDMDLETSVRLGLQFHSFPLAVADIVVEYLNTVAQYLVSRWWYSLTRSVHCDIWRAVDSTIGTITRAHFLRVFYPEKHASIRTADTVAKFSQYTTCIDLLKTRRICFGRIPNPSYYPEDRPRTYFQLDDAQCVFLYRLKAWYLCKCQRGYCISATDM